jgi:hypothetical protein
VDQIRFDRTIRRAPHGETRDAELADLVTLDALFTEEEVKTALDSCYADGAPGIGASEFRSAGPGEKKPLRVSRRPPRGRPRRQTLAPPSSSSLSPLPAAAGERRRAKPARCRWRQVLFLTRARAASRGGCVWRRW